MIYNIDFLISAMVILLLILWHFLGQKRAEDLNNRVFLFFAVLGTADVVAEFFSNYYITSYNLLYYFIQQRYGNCRSHRDNNILSAAGLASRYFYLLHSDIV